MIKHCYIIISLLFFFLPSFSKPIPKIHWVILKGELKNANNQLLIYDIGELARMKLTKVDRAVTLDSHGSFFTKFQLEEAGYFLIGRNITYLTPGDNIVASIDYNDPTKSIFKGSHNAINNYLRATPNPKAGSYLDAGYKIKKTVGLTISEILVQAEKRKSELFAQQFSGRFLMLEQARIKADIINSLFNINLYYPLIIKVPDDSLKAFKDNCQKQIEPFVKKYETNFFDTRYLAVQVYAKIAFDMFKRCDSLSVNAMRFKDWDNANGIAIEIESMSDKATLAQIKPTISKIKSLKYQLALFQLYQEKLKFNVGDIAFDFSAKDPDNKLVSLSSLRGKVIVIDLWATWCSPCQPEIPIFAELAKKYQTNQVVFISLSIDSDYAIWKSKLVDYKTGVLNWNTFKEFTRLYSVNSIPRMIIISKDFKIADMNGPLPSSTNITSRIDDLLKK